MKQKPNQQKTFKPVKAFAVVDAVEPQIYTQICDVRTVNDYGIFWPWAIFQTQELAKQMVRAASDFHKFKRGRLAVKEVLVSPLPPQRKKKVRSYKSTKK